MNWKSTVCPLGIVLIAAVLYFAQEVRISEAQAKADKAEEAARRVTEFEAERVWQRLDDATQALEPQMDEPKRREALERLRQEIQRLKNHFRFKQLEVGR